MLEKRELDYMQIKLKNAFHVIASNNDGAPSFRTAEEAKTLADLAQAIFATEDRLKEVEKASQPVGGLKP